MTIIGIDPHPGSHTAVCLDKEGKQLGFLTISNDGLGLAKLEAWLKNFNEIERCAVEGANNPFARTLSEGLLKAGYHVVDVNPSLTSQYRSKRGRKKNDVVDAENIARVVLANPQLPPFAPQVTIEQLKSLTRTRELLVEQVKAQQLSLRSLNHESAQQALNNAILALQQEIKVLETEMDSLVKQLMPKLYDLQGVGVIHAATLLAEVGDVRRFRSQHAFAMFAGCAPIERSSGAQQRRQLNIGGNRRLNRLCHMIATVRLRWDETTKTYISKKQQQGKTLRSALRCLKTYIARELYSFMLDSCRNNPAWA